MGLFRGFGKPVRWFTFVAVAVSLIGLTAAPTHAKPPVPKPAKVAICHFEKRTGNFRLKLEPTPAVAAHLSHGDGLPGGPVPGWGDGWLFDDNCVPQPPPPPTLVECYNTAGASGSVGFVSTLPSHGTLYVFGTPDCAGSPLFNLTGDNSLHDAIEVQTPENCPGGLQQEIADGRILWLCNPGT